MTEPKVEGIAPSPFAAAQGTISKPTFEPTAPSVLPTPEAVAAPVAEHTPEVTEAVPVVAEPKAAVMAAEVAEPTPEVAKATPVAEFESLVGAQPGSIAGLVTTLPKVAEASPTMPGAVASDVVSAAPAVPEVPAAFPTMPAALTTAPAAGIPLPAALTTMPAELITLPAAVADRFAGAAPVRGFADIGGVTELQAAAAAAVKPATDAVSGFMPAGAGA